MSQSGTKALVGAIAVAGVVAGWMIFGRGAGDRSSDAMKAGGPTATAGQPAVAGGSPIVSAGSRGAAPGTGGAGSPGHRGAGASETASSRPSAAQSATSVAPSGTADGVAGSVHAGSGAPVGAPEPPQKFAVDRFGIRDSMRALQGELRDCYESWLKQNPGLGGKIVVKFTIEDDPDDPTTARITSIGMKDSTLQHKLLEGCMLNAISTMEFGPTPNGEKVDVNYPLRFSTPDAGIHGDAGH